MQFPDPGSAESPIQYKDNYDNFIGGKWVPPVEGRYFDNISPVTGHPYCQVARSTAADVELALDAAHAAADAWGRTSVAERAGVLLGIADRIEANLETFETILEPAMDQISAKAPGPVARAHLCPCVVCKRFRRACSVRRITAHSRSRRLFGSCSRVLA